jgi:hypothetical protein
VTSHTATADRVALAGTALGAAAGIVLHLVGLDATTTIAAALVATVAGAELMARRRGMAAVWTPALLVLAGVAALLWMLGRDDSPVCDPDSLAQAHAAWHVASALVLVAWTDRTSRTPALRRYGEQQGPTALRSRPPRAQDGDTESRGGSTMAESTPSTRSKTLDVVVTFEESDDHTDAHASLVLEGEKFSGFGRARRAPGDPDVPTVGDELALARAMHELSTRLLEAAEKGVADFEGRQVDLHL